MNVTTERLDNCQVNVIIEMDAAAIEQKLRQTARRISRQFTVPGYRRGKAPFHAVIRVFGREAVQQEAMDDFGQEWYEQALEEIDYVPYQTGELQEVQWEPFRMKVLVPIQPEVDLGDYRSVRVPFEPEAVTDDQVEAYLREIQEEHAQWVPVERPAKMGDQVVVDAEGKIGDEVVLSNEDHEMLLEADARHPLPGFHEEIVDMSPGDTKFFELTYPEDDFQEEVAGRAASFTVTLQSVKQKDTPPLNDDLALMVGEYDTLDDLRASVRERLETQALEAAESEYLDRVLDAMLDTAARVEYPPQAVDREADMALDRMESNLSSSGIELDRYLAMIGKTREVYKSELRPAAETRLKKRLVLSELASREGIQIREDEIEAEIDRISENMGSQATEMRELLSSPSGHLTVGSDLRTERAQQRAVEIAKGQAPPLEVEASEAGPEDELAAEPDSAAETEAGPRDLPEAPEEGAPSSADEMAVEMG